MAFWHIRTGRTPTGAEISRHSKKRKMDRGSEPAHTRLGAKKLKRKRSRGRTDKKELLSADYANVFAKGAEKPVKSKIITVVKNPANQHLARRNVITKGAVIKTEAGIAVVTSRPGQDGCVNAVLQKEK